MDMISDRLRQVFDPTAIAERVATFVPDLVVALLSFAAFYLLWRIIRRGVEPLLDRVGVDTTARAFIQTALQYSVLAVGAVTALGQLGIDTASVLTSLGVAGLTIGFAARDALSNVISGIFIFWDRPFVIGDLVEVGGYYGKVSDITLRSTRVVTPDGKMLAIPNSTIVNSTVASYTNFPHLRLDVPVTIDVKEDIRRVREILLRAATSDTDFLENPAPRVVVKSLNDYNTEVELQVWLRNEHEHVAERFQLRERMFEALRAAGVDMPFETIKIEPIEIVGGRQDTA